MADKKQPRIQFSFHVSDSIAPADDEISLDAYRRLVAEAERTGMTIDEVLDVLIQTHLPAAGVES